MAAASDFDLSEDQLLILDTLRKLVQDEIAPRALDDDEHWRFVRPNFEQLAETGMLALPVAAESGGAGMGWLSFALALEEVATACGSTARLWLSQAGLCAKALEGIAATRAHCLALTSGERIGAFVGPDVAVSCAPQGAGFVLRGSAPMVTAATEADLVVVAAADAEGVPSLFCLDAGSVERQPVRALGFRAAAPGAIAFSTDPVPAEACVARGAEASAALARAELAGWIGGAAIAVGLARASREISRRHVHERIAFGKPLFHQQAVRHKLVEGLRRTAAARHLVRHAAQLADRGEDAAIEAMMAKLEAVETALLSADEGIQMHGGYGYVVEYHVERHYRDAQTLQVMDGSAELLRDRIAGSLRIA